ncbi:DUF1217 domain-containing protein [Rhizobium halophytocola]|uniref:Outer membrane murein-binding lipoprotein Lpp n=1 Tax=Rhizobium halophytocola TaxID=735519 RepID=A0ABS4DXI1_9HYPH|nr:DUF1217 domain-containing protein [Rhizobium halophytocola]MBP1850375.1 outer membrane murein-binding lipoprotein Lpp [Rhizobium halophytocola]
MVSTYLAYNLVSRDLRATMDRTASQGQVQRETDYYEENIGKVTSVDDFLDDYRLYSYAMTAYGLEDMTYAKAFMKKVLDSDLSDDSSFANSLSDDRYKKFAQAYQFDKGTEVPMTDEQMDSLIGLYNQQIDDMDSDITGEAGYFNAKIKTITSVDQLLADDRMRAYVFQAFDIDENTYDRSLIRGLLTSDADDPDSYFNTQILPNATDSQGTITANAATLSKINARANLVSTRDKVQGYADSIASARSQIATLQAQLSSASDKEGVQSQINTLNAQINTAYVGYDTAQASVLSSTISSLKAQQAEEGADVDGLQSQIDATQSQLDGWNADKSSRSSWASLTSQKAALQLQVDYPKSGTDPDALQLQINDLQSQISGIEPTLKSLGDGDFTSFASQLQSQIDSYDGDLPALGADTDKLKAQLTAANNTAAGYLSAASSYVSLVDAFDFNADGSVPDTGAVSDDNLEVINNAYIFKQDRLTKSGATLNDQYFRDNINNYTTIDDLFADSTMVDYLKAAFGLSTYAAVTSSTLEFAIESDPDDPTSYLNTQYKGREYYDNLVSLSRAFNFKDDGTLADGDVAMSPEKIVSTSSSYFSKYDDADEADDEAAIAGLKAAMNSFNSEGSEIANVDDLVNNAKVYDFAMKAVGLDPDEVSKRTMKKVLMSDLNDPKSFVYTLKDDRYVEFAKSFNFDQDGKLTWPTMALNESDMQDYASKYIIEKIRFLDGDDKDKAQTEAEDESKYFQEQIATLDSRDDFLKDRRLVDLVLTARGIDPSGVTDEYMKKMFESDLDDPNSFANTEPDYRFAEIVASFNFNDDGQVQRADSSAIQSKGDVLQTVDLYLRQTIENTEGEDNTGVRLALYFERVAPTVTSAYDLLADDALLEFFRTTYGFSDEFSNMDIDVQAKQVEKNLDLTDLQDPDKLKKLITRFTAMYDSANAETDPLLSLFSDSSSTGISADLMLSIASLKAG